MTVERTYVSKRVYRTPGGLYFRDGERISRRGGERAGRDSERMKARFRDESGRLETRLYAVNFDFATRGSRKAFYGEPSEGPQAFVPLSYNPSKAPDLAASQAERILDEQEDSVRHFRVAFGDEREADE